MHSQRVNVSQPLLLLSVAERRESTGVRTSGVRNLASLNRYISATDYRIYFRFGSRSNQVGRFNGHEADDVMLTQTIKVVTLMSLRPRISVIVQDRRVVIIDHQ